MIKREALNKDGFLVNADEASLSHQQGDRYYELRTGRAMCLHRMRSDKAHNHFEYEPRWEDLDLDYEQERARGSN